MPVSRRTALVGSGAIALGVTTATRATGALPTAPAVFVSPHQDDEVLFMGAAIMQHIAAGRDVRVLLIGRGNKSYIRESHKLVDWLGYTPTEREFGAVRDREFQWSGANLGGQRIIPPWDDRLDEKVFTATAVAAIIRKYAPAGSDLKTLTSHGDEYNTDHIACHDAVASLYASGWTDLEPRYYTLAERQGKAREEGYQVRKEGSATPVTAFHQKPYVYQNKDLVRWGIGNLSVPYYFTSQAADPFSYLVVE